MTGVADTQAPLEAVLKDEILRMYQEVADNPRAPFTSSTAGRRRSCSATRRNGSIERRPAPWRPSQGSGIRTSAATCNRERRCSISAVGRGWMPSSPPGTWAQAAG